MSKKIIFELCVETLQACLAARDGGADRIELCSALSEDGLTPSHGLIHAAVELTGLPVHVLIRPRPGDFVYSDEEFSLMREDITHARTLGAAGVVIGIQRADGTVDSERTRELVELATPLEVTFHRAFDLTPSLDTALEDVIAAGCHRLLSSGGQANAVAGTTKLAHLRKLADGRIEVAAGGGVRIENALTLVRETGILQLHSSLRRKVQQAQSSVLDSAISKYIVDRQDVRAMMDCLSRS